MQKGFAVRLSLLVITVGVSLLLAHPALAVTADVTRVENFMRSIIQLAAGLAVLVASGFFVVGGFVYITSTGNPEHLERAKSTIKFSAIGLAITIGAFVLTNIVSDTAINAFGK
jgi:TRAP-type C4-dicarboxylate transport system permease small subunit